MIHISQVCKLENVSHSCNHQQLWSEIVRIRVPSCVLSLVMVWEVFLLKNIAKDWLGFLPLLRRVSQDTSSVRVHGYSSCDLGFLQ
jgi:hypothetical protein